MRALAVQITGLIGALHNDSSDALRPKNRLQPDTTERISRRQLQRAASVRSDALSVKQTGAYATGGKSI